MIFGITNIIIGLTNLIIFFLPFLLGIVGGWVTYRNFYGSLDWFCLVILDKLILMTLYLFSFLLFWSGISLLRMKLYSRKLAIVSSSAIISSIFVWILSAIINSFVYHKENLNIQSPWDIVFLSFLLYTILLVTYFMNPEIKKHFKKN